MDMDVSNVNNIQKLIPQFQAKELMAAQQTPRKHGPRQVPPGANQRPGVPRAAQVSRGMPALVAAQAAQGDTFGENGTQAVSDNFNAVVYQMRSQQTSIVVQAQNSESGQGEGQVQGAGAQPQASQQMAFDFFMSSRVEDLLVFQSRVDSVTENLAEPQRTGFTHVSEQVAVRFSMSIEISGSVLSGFADAAEQIQGFPREALENFISVAKDALQKADEIVNQLFSNIGDQFALNGGELATDTLQSVLSNLTQAGAGSFGTQGQQSGQSQIVSYSQHIEISVQMEFSFMTSSITQVQNGDLTSDIADASAGSRTPTQNEAIEKLKEALSQIFKSFDLSANGKSLEPLDVKA